MQQFRRQLLLQDLCCIPPCDPAAAPLSKPSSLQVMPHALLSASRGLLEHPHAVGQGVPACDRQEADPNIRALPQQRFSTSQLPRHTGYAPGSESAKPLPAQHHSPKSCSVLARGKQQRDKKLVHQ